MSNKPASMKDYLRDLVNDCAQAVQESKFGPLICDDKAHEPDPPAAGQPAHKICMKNQVLHTAPFQIFLALVSSVAPKYYYQETMVREPLEPWQQPPENPDEPTV